MSEVRGDHATLLRLLCGARPPERMHGSSRREVSDDQKHAAPHRREPRMKRDCKCLVSSCGHCKKYHNPVCSKCKCPVFF